MGKKRRGSRKPEKSIQIHSSFPSAGKFCWGDGVHQETCGPPYTRRVPVHEAPQLCPPAAPALAEAFREDSAQGHAHTLSACPLTDKTRGSGHGLPFSGTGPWSGRDSSAGRCCFPSTRTRQQVNTGEVCPSHPTSPGPSPPEPATFPRPPECLSPSPPGLQVVQSRTSDQHPR